MAKGLNLPADVAQLVDQLERHCLAPDGSLLSKSAYSDLQLAREEMCKERLRYLEAMAVYSEATAIIEEYQQVAHGFHPQQNLTNSLQIYETLEHRLVVAEAAQRLRLPIISKDGEIHEEDIEKWSVMSRSSLDSTSTSLTINSSSNSANYSGSVTNSTMGVTSNAPSLATTDSAEPGVGGVPNRFLGVTHAYLWQIQLQQPSASTVCRHLPIYRFRLDPYDFRLEFL